MRVLTSRQNWPGLPAGSPPGPVGERGIGGSFDRASSATSRVSVVGHRALSGTARPTGRVVGPRALSGTARPTVRVVGHSPVRLAVGYSLSHHSGLKKDCPNRRAKRDAHSGQNGRGHGVGVIPRCRVPLMPLTRDEAAIPVTTSRPRPLRGPSGLRGRYHSLAVRQGFAAVTTRWRSVRISRPRPLPSRPRPGRPLTPPARR